MSDEADWGEWQIHDGKGCPCVGQMVENIHNTGQKWIGIAGSEGGRSWDWSNHPKFSKVIRYRIRKPRALLDLIQLIADLPAPTQPMKTDGVIA